MARPSGGGQDAGQAADLTDHVRTFAGGAAVSRAAVATASRALSRMVSVLGRHRLAEPLPWVGSGWGKGRRRLAWGKQKLWYV